MDENFKIITYRIFPFQAKSSQLLTFHIKYKFQDVTTLAYIFQMTNSRYIEMHFNIIGISKSFLYLSTYARDYVFYLSDIYIGLREAPVQAFYIFNNTNQTIPYKLDDVELVKMCNDEEFPVLTCLSGEGFVQPYCSAVILIRFWPIQATTYEVQDFFIKIKNSYLAILFTTISCR